MAAPCHGDPPPKGDKPDLKGLNVKLSAGVTLGSVGDGLWQAGTTFTGHHTEGSAREAPSAALGFG